MLSVHNMERLCADYTGDFRDFMRPNFERSSRDSTTAVAGTYAAVGLVDLHS
jgi:hypothetical protein